MPEKLEAWRGFVESLDLPGKEKIVERLDLGDLRADHSLVLDFESGSQLYLKVLKVDWDNPEENPQVFFEIEKVRNWHTPDPPVLSDLLVFKSNLVRGQPLTAYFLPQGGEKNEMRMVLLSPLKQIEHADFDVFTTGEKILDSDDD